MTNWRETFVEFDEKLVEFASNKNDQDLLRGLQLIQTTDRGTLLEWAIEVKCSSMIEKLSQPGDLPYNFARAGLESLCIKSIRKHTHLMKLFDRASISHSRKICDYVMDTEEFTAKECEPMLHAACTNRFIYGLELLLFPETIKYAGFCVANNQWMIGLEAIIKATDGIPNTDTAMNCVNAGFMFGCKRCIAGIVDWDEVALSFANELSLDNVEWALKNGATNYDDILDELKEFRSWREIDDFVELVNKYR